MHVTINLLQYTMKERNDFYRAINKFNKKLLNKKLNNKKKRTKN